MSGFSPEQVGQLLKPINHARVLADGKGHAHVSQQDILAHLVRVFGFGGFDIEVLAVECIFEQGRTPEPVTRYDVCYRALVRLTVRNEAGHRAEPVAGRRARPRLQVGHQPVGEACRDRAG
jgi:hypothetical protein